MAGAGVGEGDGAGGVIEAQEGVFKGPVIALRSRYGQWRTES